jgi:hypothetical protein
MLLKKALWGATLAVAQNDSVAQNNSNNEICDLML